MIRKSRKTDKTFFFEATASIRHYSVSMMNDDEMVPVGKLTIYGGKDVVQVHHADKFIERFEKSADSLNFSDRYLIMDLEDKQNA